MPYISTYNRNSYKKIVKEIEKHPAYNSGDLNYLLTQLVKSYLGANPTYQKYNDVVGALEGCKLEFYRRAVSEYEDAKVIENGDVY